MKHITSKDGTTIACWHSGHGEPLLLIHGTAGDAMSWAPLIPFLESHFSVWALDRRGRGHSGDNSDYALHNEAEDIVAVIQAIGGKVHLFGHSFGALCALEAALLTDNIAKLILYEPPLSLAGSGWSADINQHMQTLLQANRQEEVLLLFYGDVLNTCNEDLLALQSSSSWAAQVASAPSVHRELQAVDCYQFIADRFQALHPPTLLLLGSDSPPRRYRIADTLHNTLPNSQLVLLHGQQHSAVRIAPELLASKIIGFGMQT
jgi:pimeloyl-ACP methyl ester carboxylesterase